MQPLMTKWRITLKNNRHFDTWATTNALPGGLYNNLMLSLGQFYWW